MRSKSQQSCDDRTNGRTTEASSTTPGTSLSEGPDSRRTLQSGSGSSLRLVRGVQGIRWRLLYRLLLLLGFFPQLEQLLQRMKVLRRRKVQPIGTSQCVDRVVEKLVDDPPRQIFQVSALRSTQVGKLMNRLAKLLL